jgi:hypothetical protein
MSCYSYQPACCAYRHRRRHSLRHRVGALLSLCALLLSVVTPMLHMWEVGVGQEIAASTTLSALSDFPSVAPSAAFTTPGLATRSLPHDAMLCSVCQGLSRLRNWMLTQVCAVSAPEAHSWPAPQTTSLPAVLSFYRRAPRAPPALS